ncbi:Nicotinamide/nicotinic acid mononucleotide adenylyltransferase 1 [Thecaphora frezii]
MSRQEPTAPMPRMTDSQSGPGGPQSLKFAALSVQSYHLDSPPFTGAAVGGKGPLDEAGQLIADVQTAGAEASHDTVKKAATSPLARSRKTTGPSEDDDPYTRSLAYNGSSSSSASESASMQQRDNVQSTASVPHGDVDVPDWDLDSKPISRNGSAASLATLGPYRGISTMTPSTNRQQAPTTKPDATSSIYPDGAASADAPAPSGSRRASPTLQPPMHGASGDRDVGRPDYTQFSEDVDGQEDAASSAMGMDEEVDGDEGFVFRGGKLRDGQVPRQGQSKEEYSFPRHRLPTRMRDDSKTPLVIVACGSFSPPTYLHLRIFEMAKDQVIESGKYELLAGYYSPVSDYYKKEGLAKATHRVRMCELAVEKTSTWLMVDAWESLQGEYQRTAVVLDHFDEEINGGSEGGVLLSDGTRKKAKIMLLAGGDLIQSMGEPGVWATADLHHILGRYGCLIVERTGADVWSFLMSHDLLWKYRRNLKIVKQTIYNDISSSKVRLFVRRGQSIKYLLPNSVINYIEQNGLYRLPDEDALAPLEDTNW